MLRRRIVVLSLIGWVTCASHSNATVTSTASNLAADSVSSLSRPVAADSLKARTPVDTAAVDTGLAVSSDSLQKAPFAPTEDSTSKSHSTATPPPAKPRHRPRHRSHHKATPKPHADGSLGSSNVAVAAPDAAPEALVADTSKPATEAPVSPTPATPADTKPDSSTTIMTGAMGALVAFVLLGLLMRTRARRDAAPSAPSPASESEPVETTGSAQVPAARAPDRGASESAEDPAPHHAIEEIRGLLREMHTRQKDSEETIRILREELANKNTDIARLRMGYEFHHRRMLLMQIIHIFHIIDDDLREGRDLKTALEGARLELEGCFEAHGVTEHRPTIGEPFVGARGVDQRYMTTLPSEAPAQRGTIAQVLSPAYFIAGPSGEEELLVPARIRAFV